MKKHSNAEIEAYKNIKRAIMLKNLLPGQQLTEEWVSKNLNMSRTPVRAAFKMLEKERLLRMIPRRGAFVHEPTNKEIRNVFKVRILLECYAAREAASLITHEHIEQFKSLQEKEILSYKNKDFEAFLNVNKEIHKLPAIITKNDCLIHEVSSLIDFSNCYLVLKDSFYKLSVETAKSIPEHKKFITALVNKDPIKAEKSIYNHLRSTVDGLEDTKSVFD